MATFYRCSNNGVIALVREETHAQIEHWRAKSADERSSVPYPRPIFTFASQQILATGQSLWVTGSHQLMDELLRGHSVLSGEFYVPFSNGHEWMEAAEASFDNPPEEWRFRTTLEQAIRAFELSRAVPMLA